MLDDLKYIHERDGADALGSAGKQHQQLTYDFALNPDSFHPENIVFAAMGGSALAGQFTSAWPAYQVPFEITRGYDIPAYVSEKTLFIAVSYSGNTEETLSALQQAEAQGAKIAVITGGGKLAKIAEQKSYSLALLPDMPARSTTLLTVRAIVSLLANANVFVEQNALAILAEQTQMLEQATATWRPDVATVHNPAKQIAQELMGRSVVIYTGPDLAAAGYKWKISINENAKQIAWTNQLPEFSHNEFVGWSKQPVDKPYAVVDIRSSLDYPGIQRRFKITERLLSGVRPTPLVVTPAGKSLLEQLVWTTALGDFVGIYLALLNGLNPTPLELVDKLKHALSE